MKKLLLFILGFGKLCNAQDTYFLNPFITANYLNPSLVGNQNVTKLSTAYQNKYPNLSGTTVTYFLNVETKLYNKLGVAANLISNDYGRGWIQTNQYAVMVNYNVKLSEKFTLTPAIKFIQIKNKRNLDKDFLSYLPQPYTVTTALYDYAFTGSLLLEHKDFNSGLVINQFNQPYTNLFDNNYRQPISWTLHSMLKLPLKEQMIRFFVRFDKQDKFYNLQTSAFINLYKHYQLGIGRTGSDNYMFHVGYGSKFFYITYNYGVTLSKLSGNTAGNHELGMAFYFLSKNKRNSFDKYLE